MPTETTGVLRHLGAGAWTSTKKICNKCCNIHNSVRLWLFPLKFVTHLAVSVRVKSSCLIVDDFKLSPTYLSGFLKQSTGASWGPRALCAVRVRPPWQTMTAQSGVVLLIFRSVVVYKLQSVISVVPKNSMGKVQEKIGHNFSLSTILYLYTMFGIHTLISKHFKKTLLRRISVMWEVLHLFKELPLAPSQSICLQKCRFPQLVKVYQSKRFRRSQA